MSEEKPQTVLHGDSLSIMPTLEKETVDIFLTDPPYNTGMKPGLPASTHRFAGQVRSGEWLSKFFNDNYTDEEYDKLVSVTCREMFRLLRPDRPALVFINWKQYGLWFRRLSEAGFTVKNCIVWDKTVHGLNYQNYAYQHEFIIFAVKGQYSPVTKTKHYTDVWRVRRLMGEKELEKFSHETIKPLKLCRELLEQNSKAGWVVMDPFAGSGSSLVAAKSLGLNYLGIEIEKEYFSIINNRLEETGVQKKLTLEDYNGMERESEGSDEREERSERTRNNDSPGRQPEHNKVLAEPRCEIR